MRALRTLMTVLTLVLVFGGFAPRVLAAPVSDGPMTWQVLVGGEGEVQKTEYGMIGAWQFTKFYPGTITVDVGDTIDFKLSAAEFETVTFSPPNTTTIKYIIPEGGASKRLLINPLFTFPQGGTTFDGTTVASSGNMNMKPDAPKEYKLTFTRAGSFTYYSIPWSYQDATGAIKGVTGTVVVQPAGTAYPKTQAQIDAEAKTELDTDVQGALVADKDLRNVSTRPGPNGTTIYNVNIGGDSGTVGYNMRFTPDNLTINVGDTVEFTQKSAFTGHTVTFPSGNSEPVLYVTEPQTSGPAKIVVNLAALDAKGGSTYDGTGFFNSGSIAGTKRGGMHSYSLTFTKAGTFAYYCIPHDDMGMGSHIIVKAPVATPVATPIQTPGMPKTGNGGLTGTSFFSYIELLLVVGLVFIFTVGGALKFLKFKCH